MKRQELEALKFVVTCEGEQLSRRTSLMLIDQQLKLLDFRDAYIERQNKAMTIPFFNQTCPALEELDEALRKALEEV